MMKSPSSARSQARGSPCRSKEDFGSMLFMHRNGSQATTARPTNVPDPMPTAPPLSPPNSAKPAKREHISGTGACAFPIARHLHPAASTLSDLSTRAILPRPNLSHWPASKNLRRTCVRGTIADVAFGNRACGEFPSTNTAEIDPGRLDFALREAEGLRTQEAGVWYVQSLWCRNPLCRAQLVVQGLRHV